MATTFDVPGSITLTDVERAPANETYPGLIRRLATKAVIEGCEVLAVYGDGTGADVTSSRVPNRVYRVTIDPELKGGTCQCAAWQVHRVCKHLSLALAVTGNLPEPDAPPLEARYPGVCCRTGRRFEAGALITKTAHGWALVQDPDQVAA